MRKYPTVEIEDVTEPFCGVRRRNSVPLSEARPDIAAEWLFQKNAGWGPEDFSRASGVRCWWRCSDCAREYKARICNRTSAESGCPYCASKRVCSDNSLADVFPTVAAEWHPSLNGKLTPREVTRASNKKVWWLCKECNHSWKTAVTERTTLEAGCPACYQARMEYAREHPKPYHRQRQVLVNGEISRAWYDKPRKRDFISIAEANLRIANQWHPTKNAPYTAFDFSARSDATVWWKCKKGSDHEWQAPIYSRTSRKSRCPFCTGKRVSENNSLAAKFPKVSKEWHPKLNGTLKPNAVTYGSSKNVWWRCLRFREHEWQARICARTGKGYGCPFCSHKRVSTLNSLKAEFPYISVQLHPTKNGNLTGADISYSSSTKIWWRCKQDPEHEWQATPANRTVRGSGCPYCAGKLVSARNSLAGRFPDVAKQWDHERNGTLTPETVRASSEASVFWRCAKGHGWQESIQKRAKSTVECWQCFGKKPPGATRRVSKGKI